MTATASEAIDRVIRLVEKKGDYVRDVSLVADNYKRVKEGKQFISTDRIIER
jgi:hypothetical protein